MTYQGERALFVKAAFFASVFDVSFFCAGGFNRYGNNTMILIPTILPLNIIAFRADTGEELLVAGGVIGVSVFNPIAVFVGVFFEDINSVRVARLADIATVIIIGISMLAKRRSFYILAICVKFFALIA